MESGCAERRAADRRARVQQVDGGHRQRHRAGRPTAGPVRRLILLRQLTHRNRQTETPSDTETLSETQRQTETQ